MSLHARMISTPTGKCGLPISPNATALPSRMWVAARSIARFIDSIADSWPSVSQVHELDRIRPEGDEHLEVRGRTDGLGHLEGQAICLSVVISSGDGRFCVRAVRQQHRRAARPFEELRRLDPFEARAQMDVIVEDGHAIAERRWSLRLSRFRADSKTTRRRGLEGRGSSPRNLGEHLDSGFGLARERADRGTAPFE